MEPDEVARIWETNAEGWTKMARAGYDVSRDLFNTPTFLEILPPVENLRGLDIGCGEGHNIRLLVQRGARMTGIDITEAFIGYARQAEEQQPRGIDFHVASALELPFESASTDVVICTEVLEHLRMGSALVADMARILKPSGTAVVSVPNICSLKSRLKVAVGKMPNLAASGDCGIPLGGTGALVDGIWVGGHVVDFNLARFDAYLNRGGLEIASRHKVPIEIPIGSQQRALTLPAWMFPVTLCDFLLVAARPKLRQVADSR